MIKVERKITEKSKKSNRFLEERKIKEWFL